jgi:hypothetical protein
MLREHTGPDPKPEKQPKAKYRKVSKKVIEKMDKKANVKQLINDLDTVFSIYICQRGMDQNGMNRCYTCGKVDHWKGLQCGHYLSRKYKSTRWEEKNCFPQCVKCNIFSEGNKPAFARRLIDEFGVSYLDQLEILKNRTFKEDVFTLSLLIKKYSNLNQKQGKV